MCTGDNVRNRCMGVERCIGEEEDVGMWKAVVEDGIWTLLNSCLTRQLTTSLTMHEIFNQICEERKQGGKLLM